MWRLRVASIQAALALISASSANGVVTGSPMGPGTLYGALARLEKRGLIEALEPQDRRRPYRLTGLGEATVRAQLERIKGFAATGLDRLGEAST